MKRTFASEDPDFVELEYQNPALPRQAAEGLPLLASCHDDPLVGQFRQFLDVEKHVSSHTLDAYLQDLAQFARHAFGASAAPPLPWATVDRYAVRAFLMDCQKGGAEASRYSPRCPPAACSGHRHICFRRTPWRRPSL